MEYQAGKHLQDSGGEKGFRHAMTSFKNIDELS